MKLLQRDADGLSSNSMIFIWKELSRARRAIGWKQMPIRMALSVGEVRSEMPGDDRRERNDQIAVSDYGVRGATEEIVAVKRNVRVLFTSGRTRSVNCVLGKTRFSYFRWLRIGF